MRISGADRAEEPSAIREIVGLAKKHPLAAALLLAVLVAVPCAPRVWNALPSLPAPAAKP